MLSKFNYRHQSLPLFIIVLSASTITHASDGLWDMSLEELGKIRVSTLASGTATPLDKAAAITTVITAEDIKKLFEEDDLKYYSRYYLDPYSTNPNDD